MDQLHTTLAEDRGPIPSDWTPSPTSSRGARTSTAQTAPSGSRVASCASIVDAPSHRPAALPADLVPLDPEWTVDDLLAFLSDDAVTHDPALRHPLSRLEQALTGANWTRTPSTVALIRSIAESVGRAPGLRSSRLGHLVGQHAVDAPLRS